MNITMTWEPSKDGYYWTSKKGYRVSKQHAWGDVFYTAWTSLDTGHRKIIKAGCKSLDEAKAECEHYAMRKMK